MAKFGGSGSHNQYVKGLYDPIYKETPNNSVYGSNSSKVWYKRDRGDDERAQRSSAFEGVERDECESGVFISNVPDTKDRRDLSSDLQSVSPQRVSKTEKVPVNKSTGGPKISSEERLSGQVRFVAGIFSYSYKNKSSEISLSCVQRPSLQNDVLPVRSLDSPSGLFQDQQLDSKYVSPERHESFGILGRFFVRSSGLGGSSRPIIRGNLYPTEIGLESEPRKVYRSPDMEIRIFGNYMEYGIELDGSIREKERGDKTRASTSSNKQEVELDGRYLSSRQAQFRRVSSSLGEVIFSTTSKSKSKVERESTIGVSSSPNEGDRREYLVAQQFGRKTDVIREKSNLVSVNGCIGDRLGVPVKWGEQRGEMGDGSGELAHKSKRTLHGFNRNQKVQEFVTKFDGDGTDGQPYSGSVYSQSGRYEIADVTKVDQGIISTGRPVLYSPSSILPSRKIQLCSRQLVERAAITRLAPESGIDSSGLQEVGNTTDRSLCNSQIACSPEICDDRVRRPGSRIYKCLRQKVDIRSSIGIPSASPNPKGASAPQHSPGDILISSSSMGKDVLEGRSEEQEHSGSIPIEKFEESPGRPIDKSNPSGGGNMVFGGLENTGWNDLVSGLSTKETELLKSAWRDSTWKTYASAWRNWCQWCTKKDIPTKNPSAQQLVSFLSFSFYDKKFSHSSILTQKSTIVSMADPEKRDSLSAHPLLKSMLKAIGLKKAESSNVKSKRKTSVWSLEILLDWLRQHVPDENILFQVSRHTATLLVLASGRRIHDLTLLSMEAEDYVVENDFIIFWPRFGSKTDRLNYRQSGWKLLKMDEPELDLVYWIQKLVELSSDRSKACIGLNSLFITTRGKVKAASRCVIAGWLKSIFSELNLGASPGSIRSAVASYNFEKSLESEELLQRGNWEGSTNFFKHYCKTVEKPRSESANVLLKVFEPI